MAAVVAVERQLWLNLDTGEKDKNFLLDALVFGTAVETVVEKFREVRTQSAAFRKCIPC